MRVWIAVAVLLATTLAGCSGDEPVSEVEEPPVCEDCEATDTTGIIVGVVVDEAIRPVADVTVTVTLEDGSMKETVTDAKGNFGFGDLPPRSYAVKATKLGYFPAQQIVDVEAGVSNPPAVRLLLEVDEANRPYVTLYKWEGFIECGLSVIALCGVADGVTNDEFITYHDLDRTPEWVQSEMVWESTQALGSGFSLWHNAGNDGVFNGSNGHWTYGQSPLLHISNQTVIDDQDLGVQNNQQAVRVFTGGAEGTNPLNPGGCTVVVLVICGVGAAINQEFTVFTHIFYGYQPEADWRFTDDGEPAPPF